MNWATKNYNALGNYLHAPTIHQLESGNTPTAAVIVARATEVLKECEQVLNSKIFRINFGNFFSSSCNDCKTPMKGRVKDPAQKQELVCRQCQAVYDVECGAGQEVRVTLRQVSYICTPPCGTENWVGVHRVAEGQVFVCAQCDKRVRVRYSLVDVDRKKVGRG